MNGILCINKPEGFTSFDVVAKLRGILKTRKIGHAGTLDPMATGVLPVFVGNATKACDIMPDNVKSYRAGFKLGLETDTQDSTGTVLNVSNIIVDISDLEKALENFKGDILQIPPMYSAVSVNGKRLYELARQGIEVERQPRNIRIDELKILDFNAESGEGILDIICSKGTYVRTIIHDIGKLLGCGAVMTSLVRTSSNGFKIEESITLDEIQKYADDGRAEDFLTPVERVFEDFPEIRLNAENTKFYKNGVKLKADSILTDLSDKELKYRVYSSENSFIGLAFVKDDFLRVYKNFS